MCRHAAGKIRTGNHHCVPKRSFQIVPIECLLNFAFLVSEKAVNVQKSDHKEHLLAKRTVSHLALRLWNTEFYISVNTKAEFAIKIWVT